LLVEGVLVGLAVSRQTVVTELPVQMVDRDLMFNAPLPFKTLTVWLVEGVVVAAVRGQLYK
jgi:hypothetical protein